MDPQTQQAIARVAQDQKGVITRAQALDRGLTSKQVHFQVKSGRWQVIHRGVYVTHSGRINWTTRAWAALLRAGTGAAFTHSTAAYLWGLEATRPSVLWIGVPEGRTISRPQGTRVFRRRQLEVVKRKGLRVTSVRQTVLDLTAVAGCTLDEAAALLGKAAQRQLLDPAGFMELLDARRSHPMAGPLRRACADAAAGVESSLESRILHHVIEAHGLGGFELQVPIDDGASRDDGAPGPGTSTSAEEPASSRGPRSDLRNRALGIRVEGDGLAWHGADRFHEDRRRDRRAAAAGDVTVRVTWGAAERPCEVALDLACAMTHRGWDGAPTACGASCDVPEQWTARTGREAS